MVHFYSWQATLQQTRFRFETTTLNYQAKFITSTCPTFGKPTANIPLEIIDINEHEDGGINFYISYVGPLGGDGAHKRVKVDISRSEELEFEPVRKKAILTYSDQKEHELQCYSLEEVLVEKLRCTIQRMEARDFYDIWYLTEMHEMDIAFLSLEFREKCSNKGVDPTRFHENMSKRLPQYKGRWKASIADQINDLPEFDQVEREVLRQLKKLELE